MTFWRMSTSSQNAMSSRLCIENGSGRCSQCNSRPVLFLIARRWWSYAGQAIWRAKRGLRRSTSPMAVMLTTSSGHHTSFISRRRLGGDDESENIWPGCVSSFMPSLWPIGALESPACLFTLYRLLEMPALSLLRLFSAYCISASAWQSPTACVRESKSLFRKQVIHFYALRYWSERRW